MAVFKEWRVPLYSSEKDCSEEDEAVEPCPLRNLSLRDQLCEFQRDLAEVDREICNYRALLEMRKVPTRNRVPWIGAVQKSPSVKTRYTDSLLTLQAQSGLPRRPPRRDSVDDIRDAPLVAPGWPRYSPAKKAYEGGSSPSREARSARTSPSKPSPEVQNLWPEASRAEQLEPLELTGSVPEEESARYLGIRRPRRPLSVSKPSRTSATEPHAETRQTSVHQAHPEGYRSFPQRTTPSSQSFSQSSTPQRAEVALSQDNLPHDEAELVHHTLEQERLREKELDAQRAAAEHEQQRKKEKRQLELREEAERQRRRDLEEQEEKHLQRERMEQERRQKESEHLQEPRSSDLLLGREKSGAIKSNSSAGSPTSRAREESSASKKSSVTEVEEDYDYDYEGEEEEDYDAEGEEEEEETEGAI